MYDSMYRCARNGFTLSFYPVLGEPQVFLYFFFVREVNKQEQALVHCSVDRISGLFVDDLVTVNRESACVCVYVLVCVSVCVCV